MKKMIRSFLCLLLTLTLAVCVFTACKNDGEGTETDDASEAVETTDTDAPETTETEADTAPETKGDYNDGIKDETIVDDFT